MGKDKFCSTYVHLVLHNNRPHGDKLIDIDTLVVLEFHSFEGSELELGSCFCTYAQNLGIHRLHPGCTSLQPWIVMNNHKLFLLLQVLRLMVTPGLPKPKSNKIWVLDQSVVLKNLPKPWLPKLSIRKSEFDGETMEYHRGIRRMWPPIAMWASYRSIEWEGMRQIPKLPVDLTQPCFRSSAALKKW